VQVEVCWFIALSDAGFAEFKPLSPGARTYLLGLVKNFSEADAPPSRRSRRPPTTT
jgi:adenylosuccinate lyase